MLVYINVHIIFGAFQIWDMSDPSGKGFLDKSGFFVALKLIALAQNGMDVSLSNIVAVTPLPKLVSVFLSYPYRSSRELIKPFMP